MEARGPPRTGCAQFLARGDGEARTMTVGEGKRIGRAWVEESAGGVRGLRGVFFGGSAAWRSDDEELGSSSDIDLFHVIEGEMGPEHSQRKLIHRGVLLEPSYKPFDGFASADAVLADWLCACHLSIPSVVWDPSGYFAELQRNVASHYAERAWVERRCDGIRAAILETFLPGMETASDIDERILCFMSSVNHLYNLPIVASLGPPTVRRASGLFGRIAATHGSPRLVESLLELIGSAALKRPEAATLLAGCTRAYDRALAVHHTPFYADWDLGETSRPLMVGGAQELIEQGDCRDAALWILFVHWVAQQALRRDAPEEERKHFRDDYGRLLSALGLGSPTAVERRAAGVKAAVAAVEELAREAIARNPAIR